MHLGKYEVQSTQFQKDISQARKIHLAALPKPTSDARVEMALHYEPAIGFGGDYCSFVPLPDDRYGVMICDVTGHGIAASLMVGRIDTFVHDGLGRGVPPADLVRGLGDFLEATFSNLGMYATFLCAQLDARAGKIDYCGAGHPPALLLTPGATSPVRLKSQNAMLGVLPTSGLKISQDTVEWRLGDTLFLHTDGATEAFSPDRRMFGQARLESEAQGECRDGSSTDLVDGLFKTLQGHATTGFSDDVLLMAVRRKT